MNIGCGDSNFVSTYVGSLALDIERNYFSSTSHLRLEPVIKRRTKHFIQYSNPVEYGTRPGPDYGLVLCHKDGNEGEGITSREIYKGHQTFWYVEVLSTFTSRAVL